MHPDFVLFKGKDVMPIKSDSCVTAGAAAITFSIVGLKHFFVLTFFFLNYHSSTFLT